MVYSTLTSQYGSALCTQLPKANCISVHSLLRPMLKYSTGGPTQSNEQQRKQAIQEYIREFVEATNDGKVFTFDSSELNTKLTIVGDELIGDEKDEREDWEKTRSELQKYYSQEHSFHAMGKLMVTEMLQLRIAPPVLDALWIAPRSPFLGVRRRVYPDMIYAWDDFEEKVRSFTAPAVAEATGVAADVLHYSLQENTMASNENGEKQFFRGQVLQKLQNAKMLRHGVKREARSQHSKSPVLADLFLIAGKAKTVPIEFKSTHNLLVPATAAYRYNAALREFVETRRPSTDFSNIASPVAQLVNYMVVAGSRYGVLSSGTRSYFVKVVKFKPDDTKVLITDAWFVGQKEYLRAWSCFYQFAKKDGNFQYPMNLEKKWIVLTPFTTRFRVISAIREGTKSADGADDSKYELQSKSWKGDDQGGVAEALPTEQLMTWLDPGMAPSIPRVDGNDVTFVRLLGSGRNDVFLARWKGHEVVVKVFDGDKDLKWFKSEIRAYEHLKDAWGLLVPEPYFIADWFNIVMFGMQLGRTPNSGDSEIQSEQDVLFRSLQHDYGFEHLDVHSGNVVYLPDKSGTGKDRLVAIDLELHEIHQGDTENDVSHERFSY